MLLRDPKLFVEYHNGACPSSANPFICGANRTIITGCIYKPCASLSSCNKCPRKEARCYLQQQPTGLKIIVHDLRTKHFYSFASF